MTTDEIMYVGDALFPGGNDAVILSTGVKTVATSGPIETLTIIDDIINSQMTKQALHE
jgi:hypothetical protein